MRALVADVTAEFPGEVFDGDAVALLQCVYKDPRLPWEIRLDAAKAAAKFERPTLSAVATKDLTPLPGTPAAMEQRIAELLKMGLAGGVAVIDG